MSRQSIVVVGNGMVGHHYVETLAAAHLAVDITVIGGEPRPAYDRVHLSAVFDGQSPEDLALTTGEHYQHLGVKAHFGDPVTRIDRDAKQVITEGGQCFPYDKLVMATGSYAFVPPIPGNDLPHCLAYRTLDDLGEIKASADGARRGVVVGGGLLGLECAKALKNLGLEAHVVEFAPVLMGVQLDEGGSAMLRRKVEGLGVHVHTGKATQVITVGKTHRLRMKFADGDSLETDIIVFSAGIRPYDQLARDAGLAIGARGGLVIDYHCRTSDTDIFAVGECAALGNVIYGLVAPGYRMAEVAVSQLTEDKRSFSGADMSTQLKLLGVDVGSIGDAHGRADGAQRYSYCDEHAEIYKSLIVSADNKKLLGAVLVGDTRDYDTLLQYMRNAMDLPASPEALILPSVAGSESLSLGADALPDSATVCSCYCVSKGDIAAAVQQGATTLAAIKETTRASTGCGGCAALSKQVMDSELIKRGVEVNNDLCEHFPYTRQQLVDIIRVKAIKTFDELLDSHGKGQGCDICKPTVASILASYWNDYVLEDAHIGLQDTNDSFLGNMQKDGSYSVVPRVPGGEITPDKLIVLGEVAKEFDLYTKITGGQRIDLFGAQLHQLPAVWRKLIDAGFETGHAYGKSVRTVKSCVGSSWCRYGVDDSVGLAIAIENRYKGLRSPHKLKFAVSGCTRECAEAQSKDVGVIATESGWNLYVCGNGGMRPRHTDLLASDLDKQTLIRYIDRFLMFYVRTADRLQRTSVWLENLEGGIDYLKAVVIDDKLAIAAELEAEMAANIANYQCEWKTTLDNEEQLKRFRHFVNSDKTDDNLAYVVEREQRRPACEDELAIILETAVDR
ncbi:MAG: nitrite reductase large subunit NirB [Cellvibrionaceae bacterium]|nr:nitrite reductase large subunit NirB [Cellvibrionaceae bacterium]